MVSEVFDDIVGYASEYVEVKGDKNANPAQKTEIVENEFKESQQIKVKKKTKKTKKNFLGH